jgi:hypothetical protein
LDPQGQTTFLFINRGLSLVIQNIEFKIKAHVFVAIDKLSSRLITSNNALFIPGVDGSLH